MDPTYEWVPSLLAEKRATAVLHATPGAAGHNSVTPSVNAVSIHVLVGMAARGQECVDASKSIGQGTLPLVPPRPQS